MPEQFVVTEEISGSERGGTQVEIGGGEIALAQPPVPVNDCGPCVPPLPDTIYVTFAGLASALAGFNGTHALPWYGSCIWMKGDVYLRWWYATWSRWVVLLGGYGTCSIEWRGIDAGASPCALVDQGYEWHDCHDSSCLTTCDKSEGATCVVSLEAP